MLKSIIAYTLAFFVAPNIAPIPALLALPLVGWTRRWTAASYVAQAIVFGAMSVLAIWIGTLIFRIFGLKPTLLMVVLIGVSQYINDRRRILRAHADLRPHESVRAFAGIGGAIAGGFLFL